MEAIIQDSNIWNNVLGLVEKRLNRQIFDSWFLPIRFEGCDEKSNTLSLRAGRVTKDWVCSYYSDLIELCMRDLNMSNYRLDWHIEETEQPETEFPDDDNEIFFQTSSDSAAAAATRAPEATARSFGKRASTHFVDIEPIENSLNPKYTFEKFVVGNCNQFAHAASQGAAEIARQNIQSAFHLRRRWPR